MNAKRKGTRNEHKSMKFLEAAGYSCTRAAASLGVFDIIAISRKEILLVQTKSNRWANSKEIEAMRKFPAPKNAKKLIHRWRDRAGFPDVREVI